MPLYSIAVNDTKELVGVERGLKQTKERIQLCESLVAKQDGSIVQQLKL
ncbi:hypothetical protein, partial [Acinetobacter baumannii]